MIDFGQNIQQALAMPRWLSGRFALGEARDTLHIEARYPPRLSRSSRAADTAGSLGRLERACRPRQRHHHRRRERRVGRRQ
jgi:hypothetical protein